MHKEFQEVKKDRQKIDGKGLVQGRPAYTDDLAPGDALIVKLIRSPHAHARIVSIDASEALKLPGVECVISHKDVKRIPYTRAGQGHPEPSPHDKFIFDEYVRYVGDEVVAVAAVDEETARKATELIKVEYEVLEAVLDFEKAADNETIIHPEPEIHDMFPTGFEPKRNIAAAYAMEIGDVEEELRESEVQVASSYYTQAQAHVALEPHAAFTYLDLHGRLNVVTSTQNPFHTRRLMGQALDMPLRKIRVQKPRIGGGFGGKQHVHVEPYAALITLKTGKPAKVVMSRREVFEASFTSHQMRLDVRIGATGEGKINAIDMHVLSNTGAYGEHALTVFMVSGSKSLPLYNKVKAVKFGGKIVYTNKIPAGAYRGYGAVQGNFALESAMDELAHKLGMDPVELREKNMIAEGETSEIFRIMGEGTEGVEMIVESCKLDYCVKRGRELINWKPGQLVQETAPGKVRAKGVALAMQGSGIPLIDMGSAYLELQDDGFFKLHIGATDLGTGSDTILAQIAAEELGVSSDDIVVYASDTDLTPYDVGAYASSTTYVSGNAVVRAAQNMKQVLREAAAVKFGVDPEQVEFDRRELRTKDGAKKVSLKEFSYDTLYHEGANMKTLSASGSYSGEKAPPPYLAGFVEVEVDTETGEVDVLNYVAVVDCGTPINPNLARIQVEGGLLQGIGMTRYEDVQYNAKGGMRTNNLMHYKIPNREDVKKLTAELADSYEPSGPFGAKSIAEIGIDTPPAAIANAIYNATGARIRELPFTPSRVLAAIRKANR
ncbi:MAG: molybdopterin cofactor-binding domain-containing protein [Spirochaetia bacterium]|nr:molybdopterin cofactor-binding domain-containing protein [Spirochaetia bacterium]